MGQYGLSAGQIESPDRLELVRTHCPDCGYEVGIATWSRDPACCCQSPFGFLVEELATAQAARGGGPRGTTER
jgi:hypothetical protein